MMYQVHLYAPQLCPINFHKRMCACAVVVVVFFSLGFNVCIQIKHLYCDLSFIMLSAQFRSLHDRTKLQWLQFICSMYYLRVHFGCVILFSFRSSIYSFRFVVLLVFFSHFFLSFAQKPTQTVFMTTINDSQSTIKTLKIHANINELHLDVFFFVCCMIIKSSCFISKTHIISRMH